MREGFWSQRLRINRERMLPHGFQQLERAGNLHNLRLAAGTASGRYQALGLMFEQPFPFLDSDVYKWLEACGWELGRQPDDELTRAADEVIGLVAAAQRDDGYLNSFVQVLAPGREYSDLHWGHELYCIGHLIQAAVAWHRALGDDRLLDVALGAAGSMERELGPGGRDGIDGHPEIEMALVELFRVTGDRRHLDLASRFIELRGRGLLGEGRFGAGYWQDHLPVREAPSVAGHAVRQLYLDCGAVDVATELGDAALLQAVHRRWRDMVATRSYLTGGLGSRHRDESFGDPFELPPDLAYSETCAAIASVMLAWRLLLATGDAMCADVIERTMYNGVLSALSFGGTDFFYVNPLQRRTARPQSEREAAGRADALRAGWFACACCPPNLMRLLGSWEQYLATSDGSGVQLHQYSALELQVEAAGEPVRLIVDTDYPWSSSIKVTIKDSPARPWTLSLRLPAWCERAEARLDGSDGHPLRREGPAIVESRVWQAGETVSVSFDMPPRVTEPDPRIDAVRGCVALERGPLVYCIETADLPAGTELEEVELEPKARPDVEHRPDLADGMVGLTMPAVGRQLEAAPDWPYRDSAKPQPAAATNKIEVRAIPYFAWANRAVDAMRVWIPRR
jgi:uncharacterized protein